MSSPDFDVVIVGAGVVGLSTAYEILRQTPDRSILVVERHFKFGQETSSHHSEVVHAGIYYPAGSRKALHCLKGKHLLYEFCGLYDVPVLNCGKLVVASSDAQVGELEGIKQKAKANGVDLSFMTKSEIDAKVGESPYIAALWSPTSGIVDSHKMMARLEQLILESGNTVLYKHKLVGSKFSNDGLCELSIEDESGESSTITAGVVVNSAGLAADRVGQMLGLSEKFRIKPCRGRYFAMSDRWTGKYKHLIYPVPDPAGGLGIHLTIDISLRCRLGPDVDWSSQEEPADTWSLYEFRESDAQRHQAFFESGKKLIPQLQFDDLKADYIGVRPKLFIDGKAHNDFHIERTGDRGQCIHLLGIESPGITSSLSLAKEVQNLIDTAGGSQ